MSSTLYFTTPNSELQLWHRFAILYLNDCQFVSNFDINLETENSVEKIFSETDLYYSLKVDEQIHTSVSKESIIFLEDIKSNSNRYLNVLNFSSGNNYYQKLENNIFYLNERCYGPHFIQYCLENKFAELSYGKLRVSMAVAMLYNKFFAQRLASSSRNSILIDDPIFYNVINYTREINKTASGTSKILKSANSLVLPNNIENIPLEKLIKFRKENRSVIKLFNQKLVEFYTAFQHRTQTENLSSEYNEAYFELTNKILSLGPGVKTVPHTTEFELATNLDDEEVTTLTDKMGLFIIDKINGTYSSAIMPSEFTRRHLFNLSLSNRTRLF